MSCVLRGQFTLELMLFEDEVGVIGSVVAALEDKNVVKRSVNVVVDTVTLRVALFMPGDELEMAASTAVASCGMSCVCASRHFLVTQRVNYPACPRR